MKHYILLILLFITGGLHAQDAGASKALSGKKIRAIAGDLFHVETASFVTHGFSGEDSFNYSVFEKRVTGLGFHIKANEVSVAEYKSFLAESGDTGMRYDSLVFVRDFPSAYNDPMTRYYFNHPKYLSYPIVGLTYEQAEAYCRWQAVKLNKLLKAEGSQYEVFVRLPTVYEWEQLVGYIPPANKKTEYEFRYSGRSNWFENGKYTANIGAVIDQNGYYVKQYSSDGALYPWNAGKFPYFGQKIYNVIGNVAEYTTAVSDSVIKQLDAVLADTVSGNDRKGLSPSDPGDALILKKTLQEKNNILAKYGKGAHIVKGGSWAHGAFYTQPGVNIYVKPGTAHSWVGFRPVYIVYKLKN